jgi:hypothetical protein
VRNCCLNAAFEAAASDRPVAMAHLVRAVAGELGKMGRLALETDFGPYRRMLSDVGAEPEIAETPPEPQATPPQEQALRVIPRSRIDEL